MSVVVVVTLVRGVGVGVVVGVVVAALVGVVVVIVDVVGVAVLLVSVRIHVSTWSCYNCARRAFIGTVVARFVPYRGNCFHLHNWRTRTCLFYTYGPM